MSKRKGPFPGVTRAVDRHGKVRWRFRSKAGFSAYLPGPYNSAEFRAAYEEAVKGATLPMERGVAAYGSLDWLIEHKLRSVSFANLSTGRRKSLRGILGWISEQRGSLPFNLMLPRHVEALMAKKAGPVAANNVKKTLSLLFNYAIKHDLCGQKHNPSALADRRKESADGFYTWTDADIAQFLAHHPTGTKARRALMIFLRTGAARQDAAAMGWQNVKGDRITYRRGKTGVEATLPILEDLAAELAFLPRDEMLFLSHGRGLPYTPESLGNWFRDQCNAAGLPKCSAHGLRKAGAVQLAEAGGTELEVMAFLGHSTPKEGSTYTKRASRGSLGDSGLRKLADAKTSRGVSNFATRLDRKGT
jgi:integrase